jgi:ribonuclease E
MPQNLRKLKMYRDDIPLFNRFQIESQIENAYERQIRLPSGGSIVVDQTEALTAIDVNSSRATKGSDIEETAFNTNLEAAEEVARQMRLRDLGGLVVIDFIDMGSGKHQRAVEDRLQQALRQDRARVQIGKISRFGLLEMSRQRLRPSLGESSQIVCPRCEGHGRMRSVESLSLSIIRLAEEHAMKDNTAQVLVQAPPEIANYLLNEKRRALVEIETRHEAPIIIVADDQLETPHFNVSRLREGETGEESSKPSYHRTSPRKLEVHALTKSQLNVPDLPAVTAIAPVQPAPVREPREEAPAPVPVAPLPRAVATPAPAKSGGFMGWMKSLFGGAPEPAPAPAVAGRAPREAREDRGGQRDRNDRNRNRNDRDRGRGGKGESRGQPQGQGGNRQQNAPQPQGGKGQQQPKPPRPEKTEEQKAADEARRAEQQRKDAERREAQRQENIQREAERRAQREARLAAQAQAAGANAGEPGGAATEAVAGESAEGTAVIAAAAAAASATSAGEAGAAAEGAQGEGGRRRRGRRGGRRRRRQEGAAAEENTANPNSQSEIDFDDEDGDESEGAELEGTIESASTNAPASSFAASLPVTPAESDFEDLQLDVPVAAAAKAAAPAAEREPVAAAPRFEPAQLELEPIAEPSAPAPRTVESLAMPSWATVPQPIVKPTVIEPIVVPASATPSLPPAAEEAPAVAEASPVAPPADVADAPTPADAAAFASSDVDDAATLAVAGEQVDTMPGELTSTPMGQASSAIETEGDSRNPLG